LDPGEKMEYRVAFSPPPCSPVPYTERQKITMAASPAQLAANRANAQHSTGPQTPAGKSRSAANATDHGFRSLSVLIPGEDPAAYETLLAELTAYFQPADLYEQRLVREATDAEWRLRRCRRYQQDLLTARILVLQNAAGPEDSPSLIPVQAHASLYNENPFFAQLLRWETKFERQFDRAHRAWAQNRDSQKRDHPREFTTSIVEALIEAPLPLYARYRDLTDPTTKMTNEANPAPAPPQKLTNEPISPAPRDPYLALPGPLGRVATPTMGR
jgi:hypothetical protein